MRRIAGKIILYGGYAKNSYQPDSDIDIAVVLNMLPDYKQRRAYTQSIDLEREVDFLFCSRTQLHSDIMVYKSINKEGVVLYEHL